MNLTELARSLRHPHGCHNEPTVWDSFLQRAIDPIIFFLGGSHTGANGKTIFHYTDKKTGLVFNRACVKVSFNLHGLLYTVDQPEQQGELTTVFRSLFHRDGTASGGICKGAWIQRTIELAHETHARKRRYLLAHPQELRRRIAYNTMMEADGLKPDDQRSSRPFMFQ